MRQGYQYKNIKLKLCIAASFLLFVFTVFALPAPVKAAVTECLDATCDNSPAPTPTAIPASPNAVDREQFNSGNGFCGDGDQKVEISFDIGCKGVGGGITNPITDAAFAIIRFLSLGVGLVIVASITFAGIQYTTSRGDPKATAEAITRIKSNIVAFLIFIFAFAILNYVVPQGFIGV